MKLTPIFPPHIKPVRVGVYKTTCDDSAEIPVYFSYWNGRRWSYACYSMEGAGARSESIALYQNKSWQGLLK